MTRLLALFALILWSPMIASAEKYNYKGEAQLVHSDAEPPFPAIPTTLVLKGDVAKAIYERMTHLREEWTTQNSCTPTGKEKSIRVEVKGKVGQNFRCDVWPAECWGTPFYKCESRLDIENGALKDSSAP